MSRWVRVEGEHVVMPKWSHGTAGVAAALALAGSGLRRSDALLAARRGAGHLIALGDDTGGGFVVPRYLPRGKHPGFWDNDGRCCGTAGVGDALLDSWHRTGNDEHRKDPPLLPPYVGWMKGAAGIVGFLLHAARVAEGEGAAVPRIDTWWAVGG